MSISKTVLFQERGDSNGSISQPSIFLHSSSLKEVFTVKKFLSAILCLALILSISVPAFAAENEETTIDEIVNHMVTVNAYMGLQMSADEIQELREEITTSIEQYSHNHNTTFEQASKLYLSELTTETPCNDIKMTRSSGDDIGDTQLPTATTGDIFFVDSDSAWNHVGIYVASTTIMESMPKDGVQKWSIYNKESYQKPVNRPADNSNDSCILRVKNANVQGAVNWVNVSSIIGTPYDYDFLDNKNDIYLINVGTADMPIYEEHLESDAYNCSELVWKAYKKGCNIDLDSNGGLGVYPNNIKDDNDVYVVNSTWGK